MVDVDGAVDGVAVSLVKRTYLRLLLYPRHTVPRDDHDVTPADAPWNSIAGRRSSFTGLPPGDRPKDSGGVRGHRAWQARNDTGSVSSSEMAIHAATVTQSAGAAQNTWHRNPAPTPPSQ